MPVVLYRVTAYPIMPCLPYGAFCALLCRCALPCLLYVMMVCVIRIRTEVPNRVLTALRFGLGTPPNTFVDLPGADGLSPLALAAVYGMLGAHKGAG